MFDRGHFVTPPRVLQGTFSNLPEFPEDKKENDRNYNNADISTGHSPTCLNSLFEEQKRKLIKRNPSQL